MVINVDNTYSNVKLIVLLYTINNIDMNNKNNINIILLIIIAINDNILHYIIYDIIMIINSNY